MSIPMQSSPAPASALIGGSIPHAPRDVGRAEDVYAAWKAVFEGARLTEQAHESSSSLPSGTDIEQRDSHAGHGARGGESGGGSGHDIAQMPERPCIEAVRTNAAMAHPQPFARDTSTASTRPDSHGGAVTAVTTQPSASMHPAAVMQAGVNLHDAMTAAQGGARWVAPDDAHLSQSGAASASRTAVAAAGQPASAESVHVFVQGTGVAIVVRDAALTINEAMRCAFETARELTGERAALRRLTLNGRTIYQQRADGAAHDAVQTTARSASMLAFAC